MRIIKLFMTLVFAVLVVLVAAWFVVPKETLAREALKRAEAQIGRKITVDGAVKFTLYPVLGVQADGITIANADWSDAGPMVRADRLEVGVAAIPLISGQVDVKQLRLTRADVTLEVSKKGQANWVFAAAPDGSAQGQSGDTSPASSNGQSISVALPMAQVIQGSLRYIDHQTGANYALTDVTAKVQIPSLDRPASIDGVATYAGTPVEIQVNLGAISEVLQGRETNAQLKISAAGGNISFDGVAAMTPAVSGDVTVKIPDTAGFASAFGVKIAPMPKNLGGSVALSGQLSARVGKLALQAMSATLGANAIAGDVAVAMAGVPSITGSVNLGDFDLRTGAASSASSGTSGGGGASPAGWSTDPIDASALRLVNADVAIRANSLTTDSVKTGPVSGRITNDTGRAVLQLDDLQAYGGQGVGTMVVNARKGLSMSAKFNAKGVDMNTLFTDLIKVDKLQGNANLQVDLLGAGNSVDAIMKSLQGTGGLAIASGRWTGIDLDKILRSGDVSPGTTVFDDMGATVTISGGVVDNQDLKLNLPNFETTGSGQIDLGNRKINYLISPKATKARGGEGISIPLRIKGSWDKPQLIPDLEGVVNQNLAKEKAALEQKAKEQLEAEKKKLQDKVEAEKKKAEEKLQQKLGVTPTDGQSLEDAVKQKLQDEAAKGLLNLLGKK